MDSPDCCPQAQQSTINNPTDSLGRLASRDEVAVLVAERGTNWAHDPKRRANPSDYPLQVSDSDMSAVMVSSPVTTGLGLRRAARGMFERFTDRGRRTVVLAQEEARLLDHNYIGTEHLLLGLVREGEGVAAKALASFGISLEAVRQRVEEIIGRGQQPPSGHIPFTARAKKVLELSAREADALGHSYVSTEHLLLGLLREGTGVGVQVLVRLGAGLNTVQDQVLQLMRGQPGRDMAGQVPRLDTGERPRLADEAQAQIEALGGRMAAIERWVGMRPDLGDLDEQIAQLRRENEAAIDRQAFEAAAALRNKEKQLIDRRHRKEEEWTRAAAGRPSLAAELARVNAELEWLRAVLREHGIEPGDDAA
jgi:hypothetical protein